MFKSNEPILNKVLLPYQRKWVADDARFKIGMWSRQTGKSFSTACEAVRDCLLRPGQLWVVLSAGERQALEWMQKARMWSEAFQLVVDAYEETLHSSDAMKSKAEIRFNNGSRIVAIPANPDTARGYSVNLVLDEFAIHERPWDIWAAIYPSITNPINGEKKLRIVSTPKGLGNKFADLWSKNENYSKHKLTIVEAVEQGLKVNLEELRAGVDDSDIWLQEYMCEFIDSSGVLLPYDMIAACESAICVAETDAPKFVGMDIGRSHDLSVISVLAKHGDKLVLVQKEELHKMPFNEQLEVLSGILSAKGVQKCCIDATGLGMMFAEEAKRRHGGRIEAVNFSHKAKGEMYSAMRKRFEERTIQIPNNDRNLREDLHAIQKLVSVGGNISYSAPRSADGHSDRGASLALAIKAAETKGYYFTPFVLKRNTNYFRRRSR